MGRLTGCEECPGFHRSIKYVMGEGPAGAELVIVGEAPGFDEIQLGRPFVGRSGKLLDSLLRRTGVDRSDVYITNALKCRPFVKNTTEMVDCCADQLAHELSLVAPDAKILAMGGFARDALLPELRGKSVTSTVGYWYNLEDALGDNVLLTWHPAYVLRNPSAVRELNEDISRWVRGPRPFLPTEVHVLETPDGVVRMLDGLDASRPVAVDLETSGYSPQADYVLCVSMSQCKGTGYVFPGELLDDPGVKVAMLRHQWIGHNFKFDSAFMTTQHGLKLDFVFDTMLAHYCFDERSGTHALKYLVSRLWDVPDYEIPMLEKYLRKKSESYALIIERGGREDLFTYAARDADYTWRLYEMYRPRLEEMNWLEQPFGILVDTARMYTDLEIRGFNIDLARVDELERRYTEVMADIRRRLSDQLEVDDFNPASSKQAAHYLFDVMGFKSPQVRSRGSGRAAANPRTTCTEALEELEKVDTTGLCRGIREYRRASKMRGTYVRRLRAAVERDGDGRFHPRVRVHGTVTGRLSSRMIMLIPRRASRWEGEEYGRWIKDLFVASDGMVLFDADYSQIELRLFGWYSEEPFLREVYDSGRDLHNEVSESLWGPGFTKSQRWIAKQVNYAYVYGGTEQSFGEGGDLPRDIAVRVVRMYNKIMPTAVAWREKQFELAKSQGYVEMPTGRRRRWPLVLASNARDVFKQAVNAPIQGLASEITVMSAVRLHNSPEFNHLGGKILVTVHDSVVGECPIESASEVAELVMQTMLDIPIELGIDYPMGVDIGFGMSWGSMSGTEYDDGILEDYLKELEASRQSGNTS